MASQFKIGKSSHCVNQYMEILWTEFYNVFSALQAIPTELFEAASIDGSTKWQEIRYISIPSILHILFINVLLSISGSIQVFEIPYIMLNGSNGTVTPVIQIQQSAFSENRVGFAAALSILVFIIVVIAVSIQKVFDKRWTLYD